MNPVTTEFDADASDEISRLIETLIFTEQRLEELTGGEVDTVSGPDGRAFLLRRAQEQSRNSEATKQAAILGELQVLFDLMPVMIWFKDTNNRIVRVNRRAADDIGKAPRELEGKSMEEIYPEDAAKYYVDDLKVIHSGKPKLGIVETIRNRAGETLWIQTDKVPVCDNEGKVIGIVVMAQDVTERIHAEEKLRLLNSAVLQARESVLITDAQLDLPGPKIVFVNPAFTDMTGYTAAEALGQTPRILQGPHTDKAVLKELRENLARGEAFTGEAIQYRKDGKEYLQEWQVTPLQSPAGTVTHFVAIQRDITEQKRAETRFRRLVDSNAQGVFFWNKKGEVSGGNDAFLKLTGYTRAEMEAGCINWVAMTPPEYAELDQHAMTELAATGVCAMYEKEWIGKGGVRIPILLGAAMFEDNPEEGVCFILDLTERKKLEQQFRQSQKMESFGQLAGGVAHDFNNILAVIQMQISLFKDEGRLSPEQVDCINEIGVSSDRAAALTRQLLLFSRKEMLQLRDLDLNQSINGMTNMLRRILGADIDVQFRFSLQPMGIHADPGMMDQVLMNFAVNSRDAMPKGGQLIIETSAVNFDRTAKVLPAMGRPGAFVCLSVTDSGCGISAANLARIFEPFFTTKAIGKGSGLGLATVFGIAQQHKGWVNVESEVGRDTTFRVYFPRLDKTSTAQEKIEAPKLSALPGGNETILLVEDDDFLRPSICNTLSRLGYHVIPVSNGIQAMEMWHMRRDDIQMLITDLVMPGGMTGKALGQLLKNQKPTLKVIYASGYSADIAGADFPLTEGYDFLVKPFQTQKLPKPFAPNLINPLIFDDPTPKKWLKSR